MIKLCKHSNIFVSCRMGIRFRYVSGQLVCDFVFSTYYKNVIQNSTLNALHLEYCKK